MEDEGVREGLAWQIGVWDRISDIYLHEIDKRFAPVVEGVLARAGLEPGHRVLDLGTGTGAVAQRAALTVAQSGQVVGIDVSTAMLALAQQRMVAHGITNAIFREGRAEEIPGDEGSFDAVLASL
ncbi:MAG TPA: methyltransferase domain-containing protein, partial [Rubrobacter sp.]|nr:methyltransferase domain-containing protein [Rubrobacter sp.]